MPIKKLNDNGGLALEFGYGDMLVSPGLSIENNNVGNLVFMQNDLNLDIGEFIVYDTPIVPSLQEIDVLMSFDKIESIDVLIRNLERVKRFMEQGKVDKD